MGRQPTKPPEDGSLLEMPDIDLTPPEMTMSELRLLGAMKSLEKQVVTNGNGKPGVLKRNPVKTTIAGLAVAASTILGILYATEARSKGNETELVDHEKRIKTNTTDVVYIKGRIGSMEKSMKRTADGIEEFKRDKVKRAETEAAEMKKKNDRLERRLERFERRRDR